MDEMKLLIPPMLSVSGVFCKKLLILGFNGISAHIFGMHCLKKSVKQKCETGMRIGKFGQGDSLYFIRV